jgi:hypothetical protein
MTKMGQRLREAGQLVKDSLLTHLSRLGWEHINLTGDYVWHANKRVAKGGIRPLRKDQDSLSHLFTVQSEAYHTLQYSVNGILSVSCADPS